MLRSERFDCANGFISTGKGEERDLRVPQSLLLYGGYRLQLRDGSDRTTEEKSTEAARANTRTNGHGDAFGIREQITESNV